MIQDLQVTGMVLVHVGSVVVLTTGKTTTTGMLAVLTDTTVTGRDVTAVLAGVGKAGRHLDLLLPWGVADEREEREFWCARISKSANFGLLARALWAVGSTRSKRLGSSVGYLRI